MTRVKRRPTVCGECKYRRDDLVDSEGRCSCYVHPATLHSPGDDACDGGERK